MVSSYLVASLSKIITTYKGPTDVIRLGVLGHWTSQAHILRKVASAEVGEADCFVLAEDDFKLMAIDKGLIEGECAKFLRDPHENVIFRRLSDHDSCNMYHVKRVQKMLSMIESTSIDYPWDHYARVYRLNAASKVVLNSHRTPMESNIRTQGFVTVESWNKCMKENGSCNLTITEKKK